MAFDVDLFVIGGGSGGVRAARLAAADCGARVALAEESRMGGTCVIRGCVPKKLMVFAAGFPRLMDEARGYGWAVAAGGFDWRAFRARLDAELDRLEGAYTQTLDRAGVAVHKARAVLEDAHTVRLSTGARITAAHVLIATGGRPDVPDRPGAELGQVSDDVFRWEDLPASVLIVGGGYIATEMAGILAGLGVSVTQVFRAAQILSGFDDEAREHLAQGLRAAGVGLHPGAEVLAVEARGAGLRVRLSDGSDRVCDRLLWATGRRPNSAGLGLEAAGIARGPDGAVTVDRYSQTAVPSVFAVGDVTGRLQLTPVAIREAAAFVETVFKGRPTAFDHALVPGAVFTRPEYGFVGLSEEAARAQGPIEVYATAFRPMRTAFLGGSDRALMKLIVCRTSGRVLGCHIVADQAAEMIQLAAVAVRMGATKAEFDATCAVHPTLAEELVTMKSPVRTA